MVGYVKNMKVIVLIDNDSTHYFIHHRFVEETCFYVYVVHNFEIMITKGSTTKCSGKCENEKLQMGDYLLKYFMFSIGMGGCDVILGT